MNHVRIAGACLPLLASLVATAFGNDPAPPASPADVSFLQSYRERQVAAMRSGDASFVAPAAAGDIRLMTEAQPTVIGAANASAYFRALFSRWSVADYARTPAGDYSLGSHLVEVGRFAARLTRKADGAAWSGNGKYLELWTRRADGTPALAASIWNYDTVPPDGDSMRFAEVPATRTALVRRAPVDSDVTFELAALGRLLESAVTAHDDVLWSRFYDDQALLLPNNGPWCGGKGAIDAYLADHCRQLPVFEKLDIRNDHVVPDGDFVFEFASHVASWRAGDSSGVSTGKNLRIWRREPDHALKIIFQISAYD